MLIPKVQNKASKMFLNVLNKIYLLIVPLTLSVCECFKFSFINGYTPANVYDVYLYLEISENKTNSARYLYKQ